MVEKSILELQKDLKKLKDAGKSRKETEELSTEPIALSRRMKAFRKKIETWKARTYTNK